MKIIVPYVFQAQVITKGARTIRDHIFLSAAAIDVPETTDAKAPIVLSCRDKRAERDSHFRYFEGSFYVAGHKPMTAELVAQHELSRIPEHVRRSLVEMGWDGTVTSDLADDEPIGPKVRKWIWSNEDVVKKNAELGVRDLIAVDGFVYRKVAEPRLRFSLEGIVPRVDIEFRHREFEADRQAAKANTLNSTYFSPAAHDEAEAFLKSFDVNASISDRLSVEVHDPEVFTFDRAQDLSIRMANAFVQGAISELATKSDEFVDDWKAVRRRVSATPDLETQQQIAWLVTKAAPAIEDNYLRNLIEKTVGMWETETEEGLGAKQTKPNTFRV